MRISTRVAYCLSARESFRFSRIRGRPLVFSLVMLALAKPAPAFAESGRGLGAVEAKQGVDLGLRTIDTFDDPKSEGEWLASLKGTLSEQRTPGDAQARLRGPLSDENASDLRLSATKPSRIVKAPEPRAFDLRRAVEPLEIHDQDVSLRLRFLFAVAPGLKANIQSATGIGGQATLDWRLARYWGPFLAVTYAKISDIVSTDAPFTMAFGNSGRLAAASLSNVVSHTSFSMTTFTGGVFIDASPVRLRASVGAGFAAIDAYYLSFTQTRLFTGSMLNTVTAGQTTPGKSWSLAATAGANLDIVKALRFVGADAHVPEGFSAEIGAEGVAGLNFLRPTKTGEAATRGPLGFLAFSGGISYAFNFAPPRCFKPANVPPPPGLSPQNARLPQYEHLPLGSSLGARSDRPRGA